MSTAQHRPPPVPAAAGLARGSALGMAGAVANGLLAFALTVVVGRALGPAGAGVFFAAAALFTIASNTLELGADTGLVRALAAARATGRLEDLRPTVRAAVLPVLAASVLCSAGVAAAAPWLARTFLPGAGPGGAADLLRVLAAALPFGALTAVALGGVRGLGRVAPVVLVENVGKPFSRVVLAALVALAGGSALMMAAAWVLPVLAGAVVAGVQLARLLPARRPGAATGALPPRALAAPFWRFSAPRAVAATVEVLSATVGLLLVSALAGSADAGVYAAAARYVVAGSLVLTAVRLVAAPAVAQAMAQRDRHAASDLHLTSTVWVVLASWPPFVLALAFPAPLLSAFGPGFEDGATALALLAAGMLVSLAAGNVQTVQLMSGGSGVNLAVVLGSLAVNAGLCLLLVPAHGVTGAAAAWAVCLVLENLLTAADVRLRAGVSVVGQPVLLAAAVAGAAYGGGALAARTVLGDGAVGLLCAAASGTLAYALLLLLARDRLGLPALVAALRGTTTAPTT
ncbi:lipopolysaccharide biosynthesis protein [Vallicoccus soli]|uniref:Polysaccharide biosynthesis protein C-terminal domain-containing protein n=1 Tax=Vallicoccus soli TaxID=2339232 RepID=A0A3A3Z7K6_9ACTN|nr:oligosaccharide flippase family protein [Vallicoccus soli]RJK97907.1 hypothetical protein D5H78_02770 [Vallicoccus soli]